MSNILGNMPPVFGSGYRGVVPAPTAADVSAQNILRADGTWGAQATSGPLPSQTGNAAKLLTTDGTNASWASSLNTFQFGDVTLGTSGPSVKSSLSARAPRQGLVFDGTSQATVANGQAIGTGDFTIAAWVLRSGSNLSVPIWGASGSLGCAVRATTITLDKPGTGTVATWNYTVASDKFVFVTFKRSGTTATAYVDGVSIGDVGSFSTDFTAAFSTVGLTTYSIGSIIGPLIYNRALSASEVVALYEAGAPSGADYNSASNTAFNTSNFVEAIAYTTFTGVSATGFSATQTGAVTSLVVTKPNITINAGNRVLVTFTGTLTSGAVPNVALVTSANGVASNISAVAAGSNSVVLTATAPCVGVGFYTTGAATSYAISNVVATRQGLLLAPDAAQAGGGLVWYDTSGNAANITLPASGVSWNVPFGNNIAASGTNQNLTLNASGTGSILLGSNGVARGQIAGVNKNGSAGPAASGTTTNAIWRVSNVSNSLVLDIGLQGNASPYPGYIQVSDYANLATSYPLSLNPNGGNVLIGTTTDGGQKLQVAGTAQFTGNVNVYKTSGEAALQADFSTTYVKIYNDSSALGLYSNSWGGLLTFNKSSSTTTVEGQSIVLKPNGTTALTLDSSQNATFAGSITGNKGSVINAVSGVPALRLEGTGAANSNYGLRINAGLSASDYGLFVVDDTSTDAYFIVRGDGTAKFWKNTEVAGALAIGNTVQTAAAVASTHKVTISIGGTTYYLLATNV